MKVCHLIASGALAAVLAGAAMSVPAQAKSMKECAAEWKQMKAENQTAGKTYREFSKECMSGGEGAAAAPASAAPAPAPAPAPGAESRPAPAPKTTTAKPASPGRQAMIARERACGAEWRANKAAGKIPAGMKWPQYWSECDKRKKSEGM